MVNLLVFLCVALVSLSVVTVFVRRRGDRPVDSEVTRPVSRTAPTIRVLTTGEELSAAIERAAATERRLASIVGGRADRYDRLHPRRPTS